MTIRVLVVCNGNRVRADDELQVKQPFIYEQVAALSKYNVESTFFLIKGRGVCGYLGNLFRLRRVIAEVKPDLIHAHYGFSGLLACLQREVPVVVTFHGSDVNEIKNRPFSFMASRLSSKNIFVNATLSRLLHAHGAPVIPCGVDAEMFHVQAKREAREALGLGFEAKLVLFSSAFDNQIKNVALAKSAVELLPEGVQLLELKDRSRREVALLLNAVDCLVLTSLSEGSPQIVKEALLCNCPVVSVQVGDVEDVIGELEGCWVTLRSAEAIMAGLSNALKIHPRPLLRKKGLSFSLDQVALRVKSVYEDALAR